MNSARLRTLPFVAMLFPFDCAVAAVVLLAELLRAPLRVHRRSPSPMPPADRRLVTIQILNWDGKHLLSEFLPTVLAAAPDQRVVVVDNGSTDGSVKFLQQEFPTVEIVSLDRNYGFSRGNNAGIDRSTTDIVVLLNNDMAVERGFLAPLLAPFSDPDVFAVASRISVPDPAKAQHETGKTRGKFERGFFYLWHDPITPADEALPVEPVLWAGGGACAIDTRKYRMVGGLDSLYHPFYVEDADLSYQAWKRGWKCLMAPASRVMHKHRGTSGPKFGDDFVDNTTRRNLYLFLWKNVTDWDMLAGHLVQLPKIHGRAILSQGAAFEVRAYLRAVLRLPLAIWKRLLNARAYTLSDREVLKFSR
jgi:O-antigen biosynthesis protein